LLVDTEGLVLKAKVHSAKVMDYEGIKALLDCAKELFPRLSQLWMDGGYTGEDKGGDYWVEKTLEWSVEIVRRPRASLLPRMCCWRGRSSRLKKV
jgi:hypothetical protein